LAGRSSPVSGSSTTHVRRDDREPGRGDRGPFRRPVKSVGKGEVAFAGNVSGFGNVLIVQHGGGFLRLWETGLLLVRQGEGVGKGRRSGVCRKAPPENRCYTWNCGRGPPSTRLRDTPYPLRSVPTQWSRTDPRTGQEVREVHRDDIGGCGVRGRLRGRRPHHFPARAQATVAYSKLKLFGDVLSVVQNSYVEEVNSDNLIRGRSAG